MAKKGIVVGVCALVFLCGRGLGQEISASGAEIDAILSCVDAHRYMRDMSDAGMSFRDADLCVRHKVFPFVVSNNIENIQCIAAVHLSMNADANYIVITETDVYCFDRQIDVSSRGWTDSDVKVACSSEISLKLDALKCAFLTGEQVKRSFICDSSSALLFVKTNQSFACEYIMDLHQKGSRICSAFNVLNDVAVKIKNNPRAEKTNEIKK